MAQESRRPSQPNVPAPQVPGKPFVYQFSTPVLSDRILVILRDSRAGGFKLPQPKDRYDGPEAQNFQEFMFATAKPVEQSPGWWNLFYVNERANSDVFNFTVEYPWVDKNYPRVTRTYVILREDLVEPDPNATDPKNDALSLVDVKYTRLEDPVLDALFIGVQKIHERVPAPIAYGTEKFEGVLPYKFRVAVPARTVTTVKEGAAQPSTPGKGDWTMQEKTDSFNRRTVESMRRDLPAGGVTFISQKLTRDKQVAQVTESWKDEQQNLEARPTLIDGEVEQVGDGTTIKSESEVDSVFPETRHAAEIPDPVPMEFRSITPTRTFAETTAGQAQPPELGVGELSVVEDQKDTQLKRRSVVSRDPEKLPASLTDFELGGIRTHGSEFGGVLATKNTLDKVPQQVEEGFDIIASSVKNVGGGLTLKKVTRLHTGGNGTGPYIELTDGGDSYVDNPAVVITGDRGSGAEGEATISEITASQNDLDPGGDFPLTLVTNGDANGLMTFLGSRYNNNVWTNPTVDGGPVVVSASSATSVPNAVLSQATDHDLASTVLINPRPGGGNNIIFDLGVGRSFTPDYVTLRGPAGLLPSSVIAEKFEVWAFNTTGSGSDVIKVGGPFNIPASGTWAGYALTAAKGYRYLRINGADLDSLEYTDTLYPSFAFGEIEFYGDLTITPAVDLRFAYNGDAAGAFHYLGQRGGGGTWRNPHTNGDIVITAPYDELALGTFDSMVDRAPSNTYLVDRLHSEIWFDLKENRGLLLKTLLYQQRSDYNSGTREFYVQGSMDGVTWEENQKCVVSYLAGAWTKIDITRLTKFYRFFRLILAADKNVLAVGELELYGELHLDPDEVGGGLIGTYSVTGVNITASGSGYAEAPAVVFSGGGGSGAAGTAVLNEDSEVESVAITATGGGYTSAPDVSFILAGAGSGALVSSEVSGGAVTAINVDDPGAGYDPANPPLVKIVSATGTGATATANVAVDGTIDSVSVDDGGSGYVLPPTVVLYLEGDPQAEAVVGYPIDEIILIDRGDGYTSPPAVHISGSGAEATAKSTLGFGLDSVQVTNAGDGYTSAPTVTITGDGSGATATASIGKVVASTTVTAGGSGYLTEPEVQVSSGAAQFRALIGRPILIIGLTNRGNGYTSNPTVTITGDGSGATAHVVRSFTIASIAVSAGGSGYTTPPTVVITAPTGEFPVQATAHAVLTADAVTSIVIDNPGSGYLTAPTAVLSGGDGTGATAGAVTLSSAGSINSIVLDTAGSGYTEATVALTGGAGSGATATIGLNTAVAGAIKKLVILNVGVDYAGAPTLTIVPGTSGGTGATATATLSAAGRVTGITVTNPGELYTTATVGFSGGAGSGAAGTAVLEATGKVKTVELLTEGSGFGGDTTISFSGGGGFGAVAIITPASCGEVIAVSLTKPGGPFLTPPLVNFVGGQSTDCIPGSEVPGFFDNGDIIVSDANNEVRVFASNGVSKGSFIHSVPSARTGGLIFDHANPSNLLIALPDAAPPNGHVGTIGKFTSVGADAGIFGDNYDARPFSLVVSQAGNIFVGNENDSPLGSLLKFSATGVLLAQYVVETEAAGAKWVDLACDQNTILYTSASRAIKRFNTTTNAQSLDFVENSSTAIVPSTGLAFTGPLEALKIIPLSGQVIVATRVPGEGLLRFSADGSTIVRNYIRPLAENPEELVGVSLSPDAFTVWTIDIGQDIPEAVEFDIETGAEINSFPLTGAVTPEAILVKGAGSCGNAVIEGETTPASALYHLGSSWPTLIEEQTDPTEGIITRITKKIVPVNTLLPAGFSESFPLDIYRSIHIVSKIDLHSLPAPEIYDTTQHVSFPQQLLACYPIWDMSRQQSTAGGAETGTNRGSVTATVSVHGAIVLITVSGFRGAAMGRVEREFFATLEAAKAATAGVMPTIIRPSSGTAILRAASNSASKEGLTYDQSPPLNAVGQPAQPGDTMPGGSIYGGAFPITFASRAQSSGSSGTNTQVKDINDVLTGGMNINSNFSATNSSSADVLIVEATAKGAFTLVIPASNPTIIVPGKAVLAQVVIEKWRFGLYVRSLIYLQAPTTE